VPLRLRHGSGRGVVVTVGLGVVVTRTVGIAVGLAVGAGLVYWPFWANCLSSPVRSLCTRAIIKNDVAAKNRNKTSGKICTNPRVAEEERRVYV